ncbi:MAG: hypothetical protein ACYDAP_05225 [Thermoplasmataceae archaeon]
METELKKLPKYGEGKEAQTSPQYLERAIESAKRESDRVNIEELKNRIVQKIPVFLRKYLHTVVRRVR